MRIVMINDTHINRTTPVETVRKLVDRVNALDADAIVLVGDIADDKVDAVKPAHERAGTAEGQISAAVYLWQS